MHAQDIMTRELVTVKLHTPVRNAAQMMANHRIGGLYRRGEFETDKQRSSWLELFGLDSGLTHDYAAAHGHTAADAMTTRVFAAPPGNPASANSEPVRAGAHSPRAPSELVVEQPEAGAPD